VNKRKWNVTLSAILLAVLMTSGYLAIYAEYGSKEDPLVSLSYINDVLAPGTMKQIDDAFAAKKTQFDTELNDKITALKSEIDQMIAQSTGAPGATISDDIINAVVDQVVAKLRDSGTTAPASQTAWKVVKLKKGQVLTGEVGCEVLLRIGTATCVASGTPGLINLSSGADLTSGGALATNNLYLVTVAGRGVKATADVTLLANGVYTIK